ncbi:helix-turn-helix domain-containing protein [Actinomycetaceae bacterium L2_0104]
MARQARTTENLKERIADALLELLGEKSLAEISVSEITDRADVGRATYYRHFSSKEELLLFKFQTIFEDLPIPDPHKPPHRSDLPLPVNMDVVEKYFSAYLRHLESNRKVLERIYAAQLDYALFLYLYRDNVAALQDATTIDRYRVALHSASAFAIVDQWITSGFAESADELAHLLARQLFEHHSGNHSGPCAVEGGSEGPENIPSE